MLSFDTLGHDHLRSFLDRRVRDGVLRRTIGKWLKAGVLEDGSVSYLDAGTPQGGVISPLLSNIYLHEVLDTWFEHVVRPRLKGKSFLVRFADDFVIVCALEEDARRLLSVLPQRFSRFGLTIHPEKTRLVRYVRPSGRPDKRASSGGPKPETFDLLGFTHYWGPSRRGWWVVKRKTASGRFSRALKAIAQWCRYNRHRPISEQHRELSRKLEGHDAYYGITGNYDALARLRIEVQRIWRSWLHRRGGKKRMSWERFQQILRLFPLPKARVKHSVFKEPCVAKP